MFLYHTDQVPVAQVLLGQPKAVTHPDLYPYPDRGINRTLQIRRLWCRTGIRWQTINPHLHYLFTHILYTITGRCNKGPTSSNKTTALTPISQRLRLVLEIKTLKIFSLLYILPQNFVRNGGSIFTTELFLRAY